MTTCSNHARGSGFRMPPILWSVLLGALVPSLSGAAPERLSAEDILARFAENQAKIRSFSITTESVGRGDSSWHKVKADLPSYASETLRSDGDRYSRREKAWGTLIGGEEFQREDPLYRSMLWDGEHNYQYDVGKIGVVVVNHPQNDAEREVLSQRGRSRTAAASFLGYLGRDSDRIDKVFQQARSISVAPETERVGDSNCYVVEAETDSGMYKVWFDPDHGYNIAKAVIERKAGDMDGSRRMLQGDMTGKYTHEFVRFEKYGDAWVPVEENATLYQTWSGNLFARSTSHSEIVDFQLDPDHEALGSFLPDDIQDGSHVHLLWAPGVRYRWKDGGYQGQVDESALKSIVDEITQIKADADTDAVLPDGGPEGHPSRRN